MQKIIRTIAFLLPLLLCAALIAYSWLYYYCSPLLYDVEEYFGQIESGNISNWWSVLYMYECRWITHFFNLLPGIQTDGRAGMFFFSIASACALCASFYIILSICHRRCAWLQLVYSCTLCTVIPFLLYNGTNYNSAYIGNLDYPGTAFLVFAVSLSLLYRARMGWKKLIFLSFTIALVMIHVASFRKPFIVLVPFIVFYAALTQISSPSKKSYTHAAFLAVFLSVVFFALSEISSSMPNQKKYPVQHMLMSDLKIASILAGEPDYLQQVLMPRIQNELRTEPCAFPYGKYEFIGHNLIITKKPLSNDHEWHEFCRAYFDYTIQHPMDMLEARLIKTVQFFTGNHVPMAIRKLIEWKHPQVKATGLTYNTFYWPENIGTSLGNVRRHLCTVIWLAGFALPFGFVWKRRKLFLSPEWAPSIRPVLFMGLYSLLAMLAYICVVVATIDFRYRIPAVVLAVMSLVMWFDARSTAGANVLAERGKKG